MKKLFLTIMFLAIASNAMALSAVRLGPEYFPSSDRSRALSNGYIYVGEPDTDPSIPANQKTLSVQQEDGSIITVTQPIRTNSGGVPIYDGSPVTLLVNGDYSLKVNNAYGAQEYYKPASVSEYVTGTLSCYGCDLSKAVSEIGSTPTHLIIDCTPLPLTANLTVPYNIALEWRAGNIISGSYTLTINGSLIAGTYQLFDDSVTVNVLGIAYPEWWETNTTPGTTDMTTALQSAVNSIDESGTVILTDTLYVTDEITLPSGGGTIKGNSSNSYFTDSGRAKYYIKNGIGDDNTKTLIYGPAASGKCTWTIKDINIDMNGSTSTAIQNETDSDGSVRFNINNLTLWDCGEHGIIINDGGNTSRIENSYIEGPDGFIVDNEFVTSAYVTDSVGIWINNCADCVVRGNEIKGGFWYGIRTTTTESIVSDNFIDQNKYGWYIYAGASSRYIGNRLQYNWGAGGIIEGGRSVVANNTFRKNNSTKQGASSISGSYDGIGLILTDAKYYVFSANKFHGMLSGFKWTLVDDCLFIGNTEYDLDDIIHDYTGNDTTTRNNVAYNFNGIKHFYNNTISANIESDNNGHSFEKTITFNEQAARKSLIQNLTADLAINPEDGSYLKLTPNTNGWSVNLDTGYNFSRYTGSEIIVHNNSGTYTFSFAGTSIPVSTAYRFIVQGTGNVIRVQ